MRKTWTSSRYFGSARRTIVVAALVSGLAVSTLALAAPPAQAADPLPTAPAGTTEIWVDVESHAARTALVAVGLSQDGTTWTNHPPVGHTFGATVAFAGAPGQVDLRLRATTSFASDIAVTYIDEQGAELGATLLRAVTIAATPGQDSWISWSDLAEHSGSIPGADPEDGRSDPPADGSSTGPASADGLSRTGQPFNLAFIMIPAAALVGTAAALFARARSQRTRAHQPEFQQHGAAE